MLWQCVVYSDLIARRWEDEVFLFNPHTGNTHILNDLGWQVLSACAKAPQSEQALLELLDNDLDEQSSEELDDALDNHLDQLFRLGLVESRVGRETR